VRKPVEDGKIRDARKNVAVEILNDDGSPAARWEFSNAWPSKYDAPDLNAKGNDVAIETLEDSARRHEKGQVSPQAVSEMFQTRVRVYPSQRVC